MKKGSVELGADEKEGESESKIMKIFGRLQHPKNMLLIKRGPFFHYLKYLHAKK